MRDYIALGTAPIEEYCASLGESDYYEKVEPEARRYIALLEELFGEPPGNARWGIKSFAHDFGTYYEVVIYFEDESNEETEFAYSVENNLPETWE